MAGTIESHVDFLIIGQGLAGSVLAWHLGRSGKRLAVVDRDDQVTASKVAAGLLTPVTGRKLTRDSEYDRYFQSAAEFYRSVETETVSEFFAEPETVRLFRDDLERELFHRNRGTQDHLIDAAGIIAETQSIGFRMLPAGRLNVSKFLTVTRTWLEQSHIWKQADLNPEMDLLFEQSIVRVLSLGLTADIVVLCRGFESRNCSWFPGVPDSPVRGELLTVRICGLSEQRIVHCGIWLVPLGNELFQVGSTYDWQNLDCLPTDAGRDEILEKLGKLIPHSVEIVHHTAAVRPAMQNQQPVSAIHSSQPRLAILNGLGAKGSLRAPLIAKEFCERLLRQQQSLENVAVKTPADRYTGPTVPSSVSPVIIDSQPQRRSLTRLVHTQLREVLRPGDTAIDATAGNGFDTLFLAQAVGPSGRVLAYDIQSVALETTQLKLSSAVISHVELRHESHELLQHCGLASRSVSAITFNLGYLPGGDKQIITRDAASAAAVIQGAELLRPGGSMTIIAYRGHAGGKQEAEAIELAVANLTDAQFTVQRTEADPQNPESPILLEIRRPLTVN